MWNLPEPDLANNRADLDIVFPSGTGVGNTSKDAIESLYGTYTELLGHPEEVLRAPALATRIQAALYLSYREIQDGQKLSHARAALKLLAKECPYCGFGEIRELDHHLPKKRFKTFSIFRLNLVPCCSVCNGARPRRPRLNAGERLIHPYLETVPNQEFLKADVTIAPADGAINVDFIIDRDVGQAMHDRLTNHLTVYKLNERYPKVINTYLANLHSGFELAYSLTGAMGLRAFLGNTADANERNFGINHWRTALMRGLYRSDDFWNGNFRRSLGF